jgi:hypothetical protein
MRKQRRDQVEDFAWTRKDLEDLRKPGLFDHVDVASPRKELLASGSTLNPRLEHLLAH